MKLNFFFLFLFFFVLSVGNLSALENSYELKADTLKYNNKDNTVIAQGNAKIYDTNGKKIFSNKIIYNKKTGVIKTFANTIFIDELGNKILTQKLTYNTHNNILSSSSEVKVIDQKNNTFFFNEIYYNTLNKKGYGKNFKAFLSDESSIQSKKISFDLISGISKLSKTIYTTCRRKAFENKKKNCPWWSLSSTSTIHDSNKKDIYHKNTILKIKKLPVLYLPYLRHPDPSVKRRSGLLNPSLKSPGSIGKGLLVPYFFEIDKSTDMTISPVFYLNEKPLFLYEFRKKFQKSYLIIDTSYTKGYSKLNELERSSGSRNHFYLDYKLNYDSKFFDQNNLNLQIQKVSQKNHLKVHQINTLLAKEDDKKLENKIQILSFNEKSSLDLNAKIFEDLEIDNSSKYEYVFPYGTYSHNFRKGNNDISFTSDFIAKKKGANEKKSEIINQISSNRQTNIYKNFGTSHTLKTTFSNINLYNKDDYNSEQKTNNFLTVAIDNALPLYKKNKKTEQTISPRIFVKYTSGSMINGSENDKNLFYSDIYSMNRADNLTNPETGFSIGTGIDYNLTKKNLNNNVYMKNSAGIGQVFRTSKMEQMPKKSSLDNKQSNFAGFYNLTFYGSSEERLVNNEIKFLDKFNQNKINLKYDFNLNKNLSSLESNNLGLQTTFFNRINTSINFDEKNNYAGNERKINYELNFLINKNFYFKTSVIENLKNDFKEVENFGFSYENDCLILNLNLKKEYYSNTELSNNKSLFFNIILKPFGNDISPDLSSFVN